MCPPKVPSFITHTAYPMGDDCGSVRSVGHIVSPNRLYSIHDGSINMLHGACRRVLVSQSVSIYKQLATFFSRNSHRSYLQAILPVATCFAALIICLKFIHGLPNSHYSYMQPTSPPQRRSSKLTSVWLAPQTGKRSKPYK